MKALGATNTISDAVGGSDRTHGLLLDQAWQHYSPVRRWGFLAILFLVATSSYFDYFVLSVLIEPIKTEFNVTDTQMGILSGACYACIYAVASLPLARWADRGNRTSVITLSVAGWSLATAMCGFAHTFWQLAIARFGVGATEPGALPSSMSLVTDYFPPERRGTALAILGTGGSVFGWLVGVGLGGYMAARYGWRISFLMAGIPGLLLAMLVKALLPEPRRDVAPTRAEERDESPADTIRHLRGKRTFIRALIGVSTYAIYAYGVATFVPSFMVRSLHVSLAEISVIWGVAIATANLLGAVIGGWLADRLSSLDIRWYAWLPALGCIGGLPVYWAAFTCDDVYSFISIEFVAELIVTTGVSLSIMPVLVVCGNARRAFASAISISCSILFGATLGPFLTGAVSDAFGRMQNVQSLRYALMSVLTFLLPAAIAYFYAAVSIREELEQ